MATFGTKNVHSAMRLLALFSNFNPPWGNSPQFSSAWTWIFDLKCFDNFPWFGVYLGLPFLHVIACYCRSLHDIPKMWNIMQKRDPFLHVIAGYCRSLQWLQVRIFQKCEISCKNGRFCMLLEYPAKTGPVFAYYCKLSMFFL